MVSKDATVAESAHVRGRSAGSRRASTLVHYALREVSSRSISRDAAEGDLAAAASKLREARHSRSRDARSSTAGGSRSIKPIVDPTDALLDTLLNHERAEEVNEISP